MRLHLRQIKLRHCAERLRRRQRELGQHRFCETRLDQGVLDRDAIDGVQLAFVLGVVSTMLPDSYRNFPRSSQK